ncbi:MAG: ComEC/Rec2 family competence protein [Anaerolineales bacterium]|uniref:ComEC/Rec2 family competence protein n=1 Tax=Candidatus Desulfolinea nitratireducens TaxID=2841698 RepID=A0A8J6NGN7_9CHLR|nr:ComEC/Rec2 family competence protein [Candidatus Desulfolinea nitratireducens]MBL6960774.1 ComEC/Rec2 family competence protein [Anaerolineales bacterium]
MQFVIFPLTWISLAFLGGIILARNVSLTTTLWLQIGAASLIIAILTLIYYRIRAKKTPDLLPVLPLYSFLLPFFLFFGASYFQFRQPDLADIYFVVNFTEREYESLVTGIVSDPPDYRDTYTNLQLDVIHINRPDKKNPIYIHGKILVRVVAGENYQYGDQLRVRGVLEIPPENEEFSYRDYLALSGIHAYMRNAEATFLPEERGGHPLKVVIYDLKDRALINIYKLFPDPEASLLAGILLGVESGLPGDLQQAFKNTGTTHIIAISGFNITIIAALFISIFGNLFGKRYGSIIAMLGIAAYTILVGADAAVVRAAIMGGFGLLGRQLGRRQEGVTSLLMVAVAMALNNPLVLWDVGFQLSFAATMGLILYAEPLSDWFIRQASRITSEEKAQKIAGPVGEYFLFTLAAQFATIPIMAFHFGRISLISFLANPFILPVQPAVMIIGGLALIFSLILFPLGQLIAIFALPFTTYTIKMVEFFDQMPNGVWVLGDTKQIIVIIIYAAMLTWTFAGFRLKKFSRLFTTTLILASLIILTIQVWRGAFAAPDGLLQITFLDAGSADAILIQSPNGGKILINGGERISDLSSALGRRLPPFQRDLDWLIVASPQEEALAALPRTLERFPPASVLWSGNREASFASRSLDKYLLTDQIPIINAVAGQSLELGNGALLRIQAVGTRGSVLLIEWDSFRTLLPIGIDFDSLEETQNLGALSVLLLADSGYAPINPPEWIDSLRPQLIILSVAAGNRDGLPDEETLRAVEDYTLLRTDQNGWIQISTDGTQMWVESQR